MKFGYGVVCIVQAVTPVTSGYVAIGPYVGGTPGKPTWSQLNFYKGPNSTTPGPTCNTIVYSAIGGAVGVPNVTSDVISIWVSADVRIVQDIFGFTVDSIGRIKEFSGSAGLVSSSQTSRQAFVAQHAPLA